MENTAFAVKDLPWTENYILSLIIIIIIIIIIVIIIIIIIIYWLVKTIYNTYIYKKQDSSAPLNEISRAQGRFQCITKYHFCKTYY